MAKADLDHPALEKVPFYEARLIHRKDIHTASDHSEYYGAAEPPVRCGESHLSGLTEPLRSL